MAHATHFLGLSSSTQQSRTCSRLLSDGHHVAVNVRPRHMRGSMGQARIPAVRCEVPASNGSKSKERRQVLTAGAAALAALVAQQVGGTEAQAMLANRRAMRETTVPEEDYKTLENGLKVYEIKVGGGRKVELGDRVTVHYVMKWKGVTFMTSRQGPGVTGGTPYGFDVGASDRGYVLKGLDLAVQGMRVGGQRQVIVPPELAYGTKGVQEIPPGASLDLNIEVLSIKESPLGYQVKLIEG